MFSLRKHLKYILQFAKMGKAPIVPNLSGHKSSELVLIVACFTLRLSHETTSPINRYSEL